MNQKYWKIEGFDGADKIFEKKVRAWAFSESKIQEALKALASRGGLELDEILGAYARKGAKEANELLVVNREQGNPIFSCGENPHFIATVIYENDS
ncbi:hypothetical protein [Idiomarina ramblicola]|uniref:Uncharacterized protein n=1 Tax=Idiomarina ramblicola TaxID=263724 RepID=A0A432Z094_9GAMM|nr:hypothetical protein [Idiomarina ramblicola]RUO69613.1 hypothetical protein CWI78_06725 [Idiomarina ramblicola]